MMLTFLPTLAFFCLSLYLLSIARFAIPYFSNSNSGGLVFSGIASKFLSKQNMRLVYFFWLLFSLISWIPWFEIDKEVRLISMFTCVVLCRYFFVYLRYKSVGRGNGAPGFMVYWFCLYGFLFAAVENFNLRVEPLSLLFLFDFSLIMISAGTYKLLNGYARGNGIEYGLCNPAWSYLSTFFQSLYKHAKAKNKVKLLNVTLNFSSFLTEFLIGIFILFDTLRTLGALLLLTTFIGLLVVKLGTLPFTMMAIAYAIYIQDVTFMSVFRDFSYIEIAYAIYGLTLILSYLWVWAYNLKLELPKGLHTLSLLSYTLSGSIIWSVFTRDITKHFLVIEGNAGDKLQDFKSLRTRDEGVHSGISRATLMTFSKYASMKDRNFEERLQIYLTSDLFSRFTIKKVYCYEIEPGVDLSQVNLKLEFDVHLDKNNKVNKS